MTTRYPKPGEQGGRLIRKVITFLKQNAVVLPIQGKVVIAVSGGADSKALALLFARYGRRLLSEQPVLAHVNHGWREEAQTEQEQVVAFAQRLQLECETTVFAAPRVMEGRSWEDHARESRYAWLEQVRVTRGADWVLTGHHQEDLAETVLWALCTGQASRRGAGIRAVDPPLLRPLLGISKSDLIAFLKEEDEPWAEDATNGDPRFLRGRMRTELIPVLQSIFPRATEHLAALGQAAQVNPPGDGETALSLLLQDRGLRLRASQWKALLRSADRGVDLPSGWKIRQERACQSDGKDQLTSERWILEK